MSKHKNCLTIIFICGQRHTFNLPYYAVKLILFGLGLMFCFSVLFWQTVDKNLFTAYSSTLAQNQLLYAKTYLLHQKNYELAKQDSVLAQQIKMLQAMINSEDENSVPINPEYKMVSVEESNIGWRIFQYKLKIGDRILYEYVADRYQKDKHLELTKQINTIKQNIEKLIQTKQFAPEITIAAKKNEYHGFVGEDLVLYVSQDDALQMQAGMAEIAERYKKNLLRELKIAKENKLIQETPLNGKIRTANSHTGLEELSKQIMFCQNSNNNLLQNNSELSNNIYKKVLDFKNNHARTPSIMPLGHIEISSPYGYRVHPITNAVSVHYGLDMVVPEYTKVFATADGRVTFSGWSGHYGNMIQIYHGMGLSTIYAHCSEDLRVKKGQYIKKGQLIALSGNSGLSNGPHLHYEVRRWNVAIDPTPYLNRDILASNQNW